LFGIYVNSNGVGGKIPEIIGNFTARFSSLFMDENIITGTILTPFKTFPGYARYLYPTTCWGAQSPRRYFSYNSFVL
jgi:hypothetical protein